jgi:hypothetical protein
MLSLAAVVHRGAPLCCRRGGDGRQVNGLTAAVGRESGAWGSADARRRRSSRVSDRPLSPATGARVAQVICIASSGRLPRHISHPTIIPKTCVARMRLAKSQSPWRHRVCRSAAGILGGLHGRPLATAGTEQPVRRESRRYPAPDVPLAAATPADAGESELRKVHPPQGPESPNIPRRFIAEGRGGQWLARRGALSRFSTSPTGSSMSDLPVDRCTAPSWTCRPCTRVTRR